MTSKEIEQSREADRNLSGWMKEVAYQLALLNERKPEPPVQQQAMPAEHFLTGLSIGQQLHEPLDAVGINGPKGKISKARR